MTITEDVKVGIVTASPGTNHSKANNLVVGSGSAGGMAVYNGTAEGWYAFSRDNANNSDAFDGGISYTNREMGLHTNAGSERMRISASGDVGIGTTAPKHPLHVYLTNGELAMFGSNQMNSVGQYAGIGLGQVLANNTTYQKVAIVAEGRDSGNYISNLHFLVDTAGDSGSAVLADSKMMIAGNNGYVGIGTVYQDLALNALTSVSRNFFLGREIKKGPGPFGVMKMKEMNEITIAEMAKIGINISNPEQPVGTMSGGQRQTLAIARAIYFGAKILILDLSLIHI